jgi:hypothetical protein
MANKRHKIIEASVLPSTPGGGYGMVFVFDDPLRA